MSDINETFLTLFVWGMLLAVSIIIVLFIKAMFRRISSKAENYRENEGPTLRSLKRLETLASLRDNGAITSAEFEVEKSKIMRPRR